MVLHNRSIYNCTSLFPKYQYLPFCALNESDSSDYICFVNNSLMLCLNTHKKIFQCWPIGISYHFNHGKNDKNFKYNYAFNNDQIATNFNCLPCSTHSSECFLYKNVKCFKVVLFPLYIQGFFKLIDVTLKCNNQEASHRVFNRFLGGFFVVFLFVFQQMCLFTLPDIQQVDSRCRISSPCP